MFCFCFFNLSLESTQQKCTVQATGDELHTGRSQVLAIAEFKTLKHPKTPCMSHGTVVVQVNGPFHEYYALHIMIH